MKLTLLEEYLNVHEIRYFKKFPKDSTCPICQTNDQDYCVLLGIDGTAEGGLEEGKPVHLHCALAKRYSGNVGIIYKFVDNFTGNAK